MLYDFQTITNYQHFAENPIRFGSVVTKKEIVNFVRYVISLFHPSFDRQQTHTNYTMNSEFHAPVECFMQIMYKTWMEGTHDKHNKNPYFFVTTEPNRMGFSAECR